MSEQHDMIKLMYQRDNVHANVIQKKWPFIITELQGTEE